MTAYHKIPAPYRREEQRPHRIREGEWTSDELEALAGIRWSFTEKVDGTNIRIMWDGHEVTFGGRTDKAQLPANLVTYLNDTFKGSVAEELFEQTWQETPVVLYGEGYGAGIQKGGKYTPEQRFVLFDVRVDHYWLRRDDVEDVARTFGIDIVPEMLIGTLHDAMNAVKNGLRSSWGDFPAEGLVGRPPVDLFDRRGNRIIVKVKPDEVAA